MDEAQGVGQAILLASHSRDKKVLFCTNLMNMCNLFQMHNAQPIDLALFHAIIHHLTTAGVDFCVAHIPGAKNVFLDTLSHRNTGRVLALKPSAMIIPLPNLHDLPDGGHQL